MLRTLALALIALFIAGPAQGQAVDFHFLAPDTTISYDPGTGVGSGTVSLFIEEDPTSPGFPNNVLGWAMSITHDAGLLTAFLVEPGAYMEIIDPAFYSPTLYATGVTIGAVYSFIGGVVCTYEVAKEVAIIHYDTVAPTLAGDSDGEVTPLDWISIGSPPVENVINVMGPSVPVELFSGTVTLTPEAIEFGRGDCNGDQMMDIADPIFLGDALFVTGDPIPCFDASDANDDGLVNIADMVYIASHLFSSGPPPPPPFGFCGEDPTDDALDCELPNCP